MMLQVSIKLEIMEVISATVLEKWLQIHFLLPNTVLMMLALNFATALVLFTMVQEKTRQLVRICLSLK